MTSRKERLLAPLILTALSSVCITSVAQQASGTADCATLKYKPHRKAWLCGRAMVCSGDICGRPSTYDFDEKFEVVLRDHRGQPLETKSLSYDEPAFCFTGQNDGQYQLAFVLHTNGVPEAARVFPIKYKHDSEKPNDSIYMIEVTCPKATQ